jgi:hypothetical protein
VTLQHLAVVVTVPQVWLAQLLLVEMVDKDIYYQPIYKHLLHFLVCLMLAQEAVVDAVAIFLDQQELAVLVLETGQKVMLFQETVFHLVQAVEDQRKMLHRKVGMQVVLASLA